MIQEATFTIKPFAAVTDDEWDEVMTLDLKSVILCSQVALSSMRLQRSGTIINIASVLLPDSRG